MGYRPGARAGAGRRAGTGEPARPGIFLGGAGVQRHVPELLLPARVAASRTAGETSLAPERFKYFPIDWLYRSPTRPGSHPGGILPVQLCFQHHGQHRSAVHHPSLRRAALADRLDEYAIGTCHCPGAGTVDPAAGQPHGRSQDGILCHAGGRRWRAGDVLQLYFRAHLPNRFPAVFGHRLHFSAGGYAERQAGLAPATGRINGRDHLPG